MTTRGGCSQASTVPNSSDPSNKPLPEVGRLFISNESSCFKLKYGEEFKNLLDPRDQVLEHKFKFDFKLNEFFEEKIELLDSCLF